MEAVEQAAQEAGKDPSRFAALRQSGQALGSGLLSLDDNAKLGIEVLRCTSLVSLSLPIIKCQLLRHRWRTRRSDAALEADALGLACGV